MKKNESRVIMVPFEFTLAPMEIRRDKDVIRKLFKHCLFIVYFMDDSLRSDHSFVEELMSCGCMRTFITSNLSLDKVELPLLQRPKKRRRCYVYACLCGNAGSGKSTFLKQLQKTTASLEEASVLKKGVQMQFVKCPADTDSLFKILFQCYVMIVMIDVTQENSYEFGKYWIHLAWIHEIPVIVALNKIDLDHNEELLSKMRDEFLGMKVTKVVSLSCLQPTDVEMIPDVLVKHLLSKTTLSIGSSASSVSVHPMQLKTKRLIADKVQGLRVVSSASVQLFADYLLISFQKEKGMIFRKLTTVDHQYRFADAQNMKVDIDWDACICRFQYKKACDIVLFRPDDLQSLCAQLGSSLKLHSIDESLYYEALSGKSSFVSPSNLIVRLESLFSLDEWRKNIHDFHAEDLGEHECLHALCNMVPSLRLNDDVVDDGSLTFSNTHCISFKMMKLICDGLRFCPNIRSVSFDHSSVDKEGLKYFLECLKDNQFVASLEFVGILFQDASLFGCLCDMIGSNQSIYSLCLKQCKFPPSMEKFISSWGKNGHLKEVDLSWCGLGNRFGSLLVRSMTEIHFRKLHLAGNHFADFVQRRILIQCQHYRRLVSFGQSNDMDDVSLILDRFSIDFNDVQVDAQVGKGGEATVRKGYWDNGVVALREFRLESLRNVRELVLVSSLQHPCIVKCFGITKDQHQRLYQVMELMEGDLRQLINRNNLSDDIKLQMDPSKRVTLTEMDKIRMMLDVCRGMVYLHGLNICHNDLKPENILYDRVDDSYRCCITDFGISEENPVQRTQQITMFRGTPAYSPPEMHRNKGMSPKGDVYSFGIMLYEVYFNRVPFQSVNSNLIPGHVIRGVRPAIPKQTNQLHYDVIRPLIELCWQENTRKRPDFTEIETALSIIC